MNALSRPILSLTILIAACLSFTVSAQDASVKARVDAAQITVGDQVKLFIEARHHTRQSRLEWAVIPDTFNTLEITERGKIDTMKEGDIAIYKQRLLITGFDSGSFKVPAFQFTVIPNSGAPFTIHTDSFQLSVSTVPVDTTKPFRPIKGIMAVKTTWKDYLLLIAGGVILLILATITILYFRKNKKTTIPPPTPKIPPETAQEKALRLLLALEQQQLWQAGRIKEYYTLLTDILRGYIEDRFHTSAMELTTDELLQKAKMHPEMNAYHDQLAQVLYTADLAKFAKAQPLPQEHARSMDSARQFITDTKPAVTADIIQKQS